MKNKKPSFLLYRSFYEPIKNLNNEDLGKLFRSIYEYQVSETIPDSNTSIYMAFQFFKNQFDLDSEKYLQRCEKNSENVKKRWNKEDTNVNERKQSITKRTDKDKDKDIDKEKDKDKDIDIVVYPFHTERFSDAWNFWLKFKKDSFRFTYKTPISEQTALKQLFEISNGKEETALSIIENSVANGYKGLFPLKNGNNGNGNSGISTDYVQKLKERLT